MRRFFDEHGTYLNPNEPIYLCGRVIGGTPKFHIGRTDLLAHCRDEESAISTMLRDEVMYKNIKNGNASDKVLKKDAEAIQRISNKKRKAEEKERIWKPANESLNRYRKRYKQDPL